MSHRIFGRDYPERVNAIVIGGGVGGLTLANLLADGGLKVLLIERHWMLGGFCSTFRRRGFLFDAATHFYPLLGNRDASDSFTIPSREGPIRLAGMPAFVRTRGGGYFFLPGKTLLDYLAALVDVKT